MVIFHRYVSFPTYNCGGTTLHHCFILFGGASQVLSKLQTVANQRKFPRCHIGFYNVPHENTSTPYCPQWKQHSHTAKRSQVGPFRGKEPPSNLQRIVEPPLCSLTVTKGTSSASCAAFKSQDTTSTSDSLSLLQADMFDGSLLSEFLHACMYYGLW